jgi:Txe/YoeB family toxin of Txe-Axe toxin-antitoxin module
MPKPTPRAKPNLKAEIKSDHPLVQTEIDDIINKSPKAEKTKLEDMPLNSLGDYMRYNEETRRLTKMAKKLDKRLKETPYEIKQCPEELHPKERIRFGRNDQPTNPLTVHLSNDMIHFEKKLVPGKIYDLPRCVVEHLADKGTAVWEWVDNPDGSRETRIVGKNNRFSIRPIYKD